jgi:hypothetical protein
MGSSVTPPTAVALRAAVARLPRPVSVRTAALHLATPVSEAVGIAVRATDDGWRYRQCVVAATSDPYTDAAVLAAAGHRHEDTYLDLDATPDNWVKVRRSGCRRVAFGTDVLFGAPLVVLDDHVPDEAAGRFATRIATGDPIGSPAVLNLAGLVVLAEAGSRTWELTSPTAARTGSPSPVELGDIEMAGTVDVSACGSIIAAKLGAIAFDAEFVGQLRTGVVVIRYVLDLLDLWQAEVPAALSMSSELIGVPVTQVAPASPETLPPGWQWLGRYIYDDAVVACHRDSGIQAVLHRLPRRIGQRRSLPQL